MLNSYMRRRATSLSFLCSKALSTVRACIVGAGPAGYYTAQRLLKSDENIHVDIIDKLPVPFGLVRFGVAPDHPEVKNVIHTFTQTATKHKERCRFIGNLDIGTDIQASDLFNSYDVVILSYGAENDRKLGILGEDSNGVYSAREFVGWYNGLPEFANLNPDLSKESAVILGQGNVALDIARLLLMPVDELAKTDVCRHALDVIATSKLKNIYIVGRRGPLQAAFTIKEFRELTKLPEVQPNVSSEDFANVNIAELARPRRRLTELMLKMAQSPADLERVKTWSLKFLLTPQQIISSDNQVSAVQFIKNRLVGKEKELQRAELTSETVNIPCDIVIRSIGYQSLSIADSSTVPFDSKTCTIPNTGGRVHGIPGLYCSGWVKRGPVGVIATTMSDAFETADSVIEDLKSGLVKPSTRRKVGLSELLSNMGKDTVDFGGWEKIDKEEVGRGEKGGKPREKIVSIEEMMRVAKR